MIIPTSNPVLAKRTSAVIPDIDDEVPFLGSKKVCIERSESKPHGRSDMDISVQTPECLVARFFDFQRRENNVVVVVTPPHGAIGTCEVSENDLSTLTVKWTWTDTICNAELLFEKELFLAPTARTYVKMAAVQEAYSRVCGKNGAKPETVTVVQLPFPVRVQKECIKVTHIEGAVPRMIIELVADTGTQNSELVTAFSI